MFVFFFFFKQKTAYDMRISDWSSDVCSSDLHFENNHTTTTDKICLVADGGQLLFFNHTLFSKEINFSIRYTGPRLVTSNEVKEMESKAKKIGRASCRERVCQYV